MLTKSLLDKIISKYPLDISGIHGVAHWARVRENGLLLAEVTGAIKTVVELFAVFHDSQRNSDGYDDGHGLRGARLAETFYGNNLNLSKKHFSLLYAACSRYTFDKTHPDITVQTCFDADRLDLGRVGNMPIPGYLCTDAARNPQTLDWANARSTRGIVPDFVFREWNIDIN